MTDDVAERLNTTTQAIFAEIPKRLGIDEIVKDAYGRLLKECPDHPDLVVQKLVEVVREIATHAVSEFTRRTHEPFMWVDEPDFNPSTDNVLMNFALGPGGHVIFADQVEPDKKP